MSGSRQSMGDASGAEPPDRAPAPLSDEQKKAQEAITLHTKRFAASHFNPSVQVALMHRIAAARLFLTNDEAFNFLDLYHIFTERNAEAVPPKPWVVSREEHERLEASYRMLILAINPHRLAEAVFAPIGAARNETNYIFVHECAFGIWEGHVTRPVPIAPSVAKREFCAMKICRLTGESDRNVRVVFMRPLPATPRGEFLAMSPMYVDFLEQHVRVVMETLGPGNCSDPFGSRSLFFSHGTSAFYPCCVRPDNPRGGVFNPATNDPECMYVNVLGDDRRRIVPQYSQAEARTSFGDLFTLIASAYGAALVWRAPEASQPSMLTAVVNSLKKVKAFVLDWRAKSAEEKKNKETPRVAPEPRVQGQGRAGQYSVSGVEFQAV